MSDGTNAHSATPHDPSQTPHLVDDAKQEASELTHTAADSAKDVAGVAKDEVASVAHTTKAQAADLFEEARREFGDQASKQQQRLSAGLDSLGSELRSMAQSSEGTGIASDLVQKASDKISGAATWLGHREPAGVIQDLKSFARRRPGAFVAAALLAGIVAGRLTRALAANAKEDSSAAPGPAAGVSHPEVITPPTVVAPPSVVAPPVRPETPLYSETAAQQGGTGSGVTYERPDAL